MLADGRVYVSHLLDIWAPSFQLWCRVGDRGPIFRGTRSTHTFTARQGGRLWLASHFPGEWADQTGRLATPADRYAEVSGGMWVLLLRWPSGTAAPALFRGFAKHTRVPGLVLAEAHRFDEPVPASDEGDWKEKRAARKSADVVWLEAQLKPKYLPGDADLDRIP